MASLILGAGMLTYTKIKESRAKKREKKLWREASYKDLERETQERLAARDGTEKGVAKQATKVEMGEKAARGRNNPFFAKGQGDGEKGRARSRSESEGSRRSQDSGRDRDAGNASAKGAPEKKGFDAAAPIGQSPQWWEEKKRNQ